MIVFWYTAHFLIPSKRMCSPKKLLKYTGKENQVAWRWNGKRDETRRWTRGCTMRRVSQLRLRTPRYHQRVSWKEVEVVKWSGGLAMGWYQMDSVLMSSSMDVGSADADVDVWWGWLCVWYHIYQQNSFASTNKNQMVLQSSFFLGFIGSHHHGFLLQRHHTNKPWHHPHPMAPPRLHQR